MLAISLHLCTAYMVGVIGQGFSHFPTTRAPQIVLWSTVSLDLGTGFLLSATIEVRSVGLGSDGSPGFSLRYSRVH